MAKLNGKERREKSLGEMLKEMIFSKEAVILKTLNLLGEIPVLEEPEGIREIDWDLCDQSMGWDEEERKEFFEWDEDDYDLDQDLGYDEEDESRLGWGARESGELFEYEDQNLLSWEEEDLYDFDALLLYWENTSDHWEWEEEGFGKNRKGQMKQKGRGRRNNKRWGKK